jgi:hypothetical protein
MSECFLAVDHDNWYVVSIPPQQRGVTFNIYLLKRIFIYTLGTVYSLFGFFAKVTAWPVVYDHVGFCFVKVHAANISLAMSFSQTAGFRV